jgi:DNA helicase HerA-like ATPase
MSQFLMAVKRWGDQHPSPDLQAVFLFDEADLYLPAQSKPSTKGPMEDLLKRARSAGIGLLLATQSPGDFDYKCRDNIRTWLVGKIKEPTAIRKMKPMLSECKDDVSLRLPAQKTGEFHLLRDGEAIAFQADRSLLVTEQLAEEEILTLANRAG